jgi:hypothetical protein
MTDQSPIEPCATCGEQVRVPTLLARRNFDARNKRCVSCAATPEELDRVVTAMLKATNWDLMPLSTKLAIAAEVGRA